MAVHRDFTVPQVSGPCARCGSEEVEMGWVRDSHLHRLNFQLEPRSEASKLAGRGTGLIYGRMCRSCNFLELFVDGMEFDD
ncbi:MAG: hypothetical protein M9921_09265 [Fimbriimonadaceae bacterium]|nr:hypothetical protein [Fimbriimonadaceae bacterium]